MKDRALAFGGYNTPESCDKIRSFDLSTVVPQRFFSKLTNHFCFNFKATLLGLIKDELIIPIKTGKPSIELAKEIAALSRTHGRHVKTWILFEMKFEGQRGWQGSRLSTPGSKDNKKAYQCDFASVQS
jgi:hypothetical protein